MAAPSPPPGFELDAGDTMAPADLPPPPPGFVMDGAPDAAVSAPAAPVEESNWLTDLVPQMLERSSQIAGGTIQGAAGTGDALGEGREGAEFLPDMVDRPDFWDYAQTPEGMAELERQMGGMGQAAPGQITPTRQLGENVGETLEGVDLGYEQRTSWDDVKNDPLSNVGPFIGEQFVNSVPDMAAMLLNLPAYVLGRTGEIADDRAENDGRDIASVDDLAVAGPAAVASSALDRFALGKSIGLGEAAVTGGKELAKQAGKAAVREAGTEAIQENIEYGATNAGTQEGYDLGEAMDRGLAGAVAGAGIGGGMRGATGGVELLRQPRAARPEAAPPEADPSLDRVNTVELEPAQTEQVPAQTEQVVEPDVQPVPAPASTSEQAAPTSPEATPEVTPENNPRRAKVYTPDNEGIDVEYQVIDADQVMTSDQAGFDQNAQPRDRSDTNKNSEAQIESIANSPNFDRLYRSPETDRGAPVIGEDGLVESGNGRVMGLRRAYERGTAEEYRQRVLSEFPEAANMARPIIVARRISQVDRTDFAYRSNIPATMQMSATELATAEARMVDDQVVSLYRGGDILGLNNREMVRTFIGKLPKSQQNGLITPEGGLSVEGQRRFEAAIFHRAYGDRQLLSRLTARLDDDMKSVTNALRSAAPRMAQLQNAIDRGEVSPDAGLASAMSEAMTKLADIRAKGTNLRTARAQAEAFEAPLSPAADVLLNAFYNPEGTRLVSQDRIVEFLEDFAENAMKARIDQANLPGVEAAPTKNAEQLANEALERQREGSAASEPATLFEPASSAVGRGEPGARRAEARRPADDGAGAARPDAVRTDGNAEGVTDEDLFGDLEGEADLDFAGDILADTAVDRTPAGSLAPGFDAVSRNNKRSVWEQAYVDAGLSADEGVNLPPAQRRNVLARLLEKTFGFSVEFGRGAQTVDVVNAMLDGYQNIRMMLSTLQLPLQAISLDGSVTLSLDKQNNRYLGAYDPATKTIHMPGRSNSFAHEWMHALDDFLLGKLKPGMSGRLLSQATRQQGLDPNNPLEASFINLVHRMFFDQSDLALKMLELEKEAAKVVTKGPNAGQPTAAAKKAQEQLDRLNAGATRIRSIAPTAYRATSKAFGQATSGDAGSQYYGSVHEMLARAFEAYIGHKVKLAGGTNEFITKGDDAYLDEADTRLAMTFPKTGERLEIFSAFDDLFGELRNVGTLGTGPAASAPDMGNAYDPNRYVRQSMSNKAPNVFRATMEEFRRMSNVTRDAVSGGFVKSLKSGVSGLALNMGYSKDGTVLRDLRVGTQKLLGSMRGYAKLLMSLNQGKGDRFMQFMADRFMTDPGLGRDTQGAVWEEVRERFTSRVAARIGAVLENNGFGAGWKGYGSNYTYTAEDSAILQDLMWGKQNAKATAQHKAVAGELRRIMDEAFIEAKAAGLDLGYIENKGYLPRIILSDIVEQKSEAFLKAAAEVYGIKFDNDTSSMTVDEILAFAAGIGLETDPLGWRDKNNPHPFRPLIAKIKGLQRKLKQSAANPTYDPTQDQDALDQAKQDLLDLMRPDYSDTAAMKWRERILIGDSFTYDSHGPASNFMKGRLLPAEADEILREFYENDVPLMAFNYAAKVKAKAEFQKRAGIPSGNKRLEDVLRREGVAKAVKANPRKYNAQNEEGRMNILRDLTDTTKDNLIEISMNEALKAGAVAKDVTAFRGVLEEFTGQRQGGRAAYYSNMMANGLYAYAMIRLLARTAFTSLAEPMTIILQTGNFKAGMVAFKNYMGELAGVLTGESDTIRERAAVARVVGIVTEPLYDGLMENRLSGDFNTDRIGSSNGMVARFMRANLLTGLTNIQRRVAMNAGFVWLNDMAVRHKDASTSDYTRKVFEAELRDLGVPQKHVPAMIDWLAQKDTPPTLTDLNTPAGQIYADTVARLVDRVITNPRKADKPIYASTPVGRVVFTLMSFLYTFFRNVHLATANRAKRNYQLSRDLGSSKAGAMVDATFGPSGVAPSFVVGFMMLGLANFITTAIREAIFNSEQWEEKDDERFGWLFALAVSRSGIYGPADILINSYKGLKYERDLTSLAAGVSPSIILSDVQNMVKLFGDKNSANTNTSERTAAKSLYNLTMAPALNLTLSSMNPVGPVGWAARYAAMVYGSSASAASGFADIVAGEQTKK